jgi:hypothetical protein
VVRRLEEIRITAPTTCIIQHCPTTCITSGVMGAYVGRLCIFVSSSLGFLCIIEKRYIAKYQARIEVKCSERLTSCFMKGVIARLDWKQECNLDGRGVSVHMLASRCGSTSNAYLRPTLNPWSHGGVAQQSHRGYDEDIDNRLVLRRIAL